MRRKKLPIGIRTFRQMREEDCYYVDKTAYALKLVEGGERHRRSMAMLDSINRPDAAVTTFPRRLRVWRHAEQKREMRPDVRRNPYQLGMAVPLYARTASSTTRWAAARTTLRRPCPGEGFHRIAGQSGGRFLATLAAKEVAR